MKAPILGRVKAYEFNIALGLVLAESVILLWMSFTPGAVVEAYSFLYFNTATFGHLMAYMAYGCLLGRVFGLRNGALEKREIIFLALVIGTCFGLINEMIQSGIPGRSMSMVDVTANLIGAFIGGWISARF